MVFSEAARRYLNELARTNGKDLEKKQRRLVLHLIPFFGRIQLSKIDSRSVERYKSERREQPSGRGGVRRGVGAKTWPISDPNKLTCPATINRELAVLSHLLSRAVEWGWIASTPVKIRRFQEQRTRFEYLTEAEIGHLLAATAADSHPQIYAFVYIALHTAMRSGEILSLRREFVDLAKLQIHLPKAKTGARDVPISANLEKFLCQWLGSFEGDRSWLFASSSSSTGHTTDLAKPWRRIIEAAGLADRHITRHTLRHTAITHLVQAGVDLPTVQRVSGHTTFEMVSRYSHQNQQHVQDALDKLDARIERYTVCRGAPTARATSGGLFPVRSIRPARTRRLVASSSLLFPVMRTPRCRADIDITHDRRIGCHEVT